MKKTWKQKLFSLILTMALVCTNGWYTSPVLHVSAAVTELWNDDRFAEATTTKKYVALYNIVDAPTSSTRYDYLTVLYASDYPMFLYSSSSETTCKLGIIKNNQCVPLATEAEMQVYIDIPYYHEAYFQPKYPTRLNGEELYINDTASVYSDTSLEFLLKKNSINLATITVPVFDTIESAQSYFHNGDASGLVKEADPWTKDFAMSDINVTDKIDSMQNTAVSQSALFVDDFMLGYGAVLSVPARMDLTYDESIDIFQSSDVISARGHIFEFAEIIMKIPEEITYTLRNSNKTLDGIVTFGTNINGVNTNTWTSDEVEMGRYNTSSAVKKTVSINVLGTEVHTFGDYEAIMEVDIAMGIAGHLRSLCDPTTSVKAVCASVQGDTGIGSLQNPEALEIWNLNNLTVEASGNVSKVLLETGANDSTVTQIEMGTGEIYYGGNVQLKDPETITSWIMNCPSLQLLVVPSEITTTQLHACYDQNISDIGIVDYNNQKFYDSYAEVGNALSFVKGVRNGLYVYVPHIVFRGTKEQWKTLSGTSDWIFGNASNAVTVHCTDGKLLYY